MDAYNFKSIMHLMHKANDNGIGIFVDDHGLKVRLPKGESVDPLLIAELKKNKNELLKILTGQKNNKGNTPQIIHEGRVYHEITRAQVWWVDMETFSDFKESIFGLYRAKLTGFFNYDIFDKSIQYVVARHESLRSSFCKIGDKYVMHVNDIGSSLYKVDFKNYADFSSSEIDDVDKFLNFEGHKFKMADGPLFLVRLLEVNDNEFHVSIKMHHAIYDGWSIEVLWRDLFTAYTAIMQNDVPALPALVHQYKDCMYFLNEHVKENEESHRRYWSEVCPQLPEPFQLPASKRGNHTVKIPQKESMVIEKELATSLNNLAEKYRVNLFKLLQASLSSFFHFFANRKDIFFATTVFGRDAFEGMGDQIGFYSKMILMKVDINSDDSFGKIIRKVEQAHEDTQKYRAYTLMQRIESQLPAGANIFDYHWKVTIEFSEEEGYTDKKDFQWMLSKLPFEIQLYPEEEVNFMNEDLRFNFFQAKEGLKLNLLYNSTLFEVAAIRDIIKSYKDHLFSLR